MLKRFLLILGLVLSAHLALGQGGPGLSNYGGGAGVTITTVAGLATVPGKTKGTIAVVLDGNSATDCTTGASSTTVVCQYNGSTWAQMVASSSGGTAFSALTGSTNSTAAMVIGTGGSLTVSGSGSNTATALTGTPSITVNGLTATTYNGGALSGTFTGAPTFSGNIAFSGTPTFSNTLALNTSGNAGTATKWASARNLAGNSVDGSANATFANKFIVQGTTDAGLSAAQFLGALGTGLVKNTTTTGILSIGAAADVYGLFTSCTGSSGLFLEDGGTCAAPGGSGTVTVVGAGSLTSTALVTGGGTTTLQTPSAASTLSSGGNLVLAGSIATNSASAVCGSSSPCFGGVEGATQPTPTAGDDFIHFNSTAHCAQGSYNGGALGCIPLGPTTAPTSGNLVQWGANFTQADAGFAGTLLIVSGTSAMGTGAITSGTCATVVTTTATGAATTDNLIANPNADPTAVTGYAPSASGSLYIQAYITSGNVNFKVCNNTSGSLTPSALTMQWRVVR